MFRLCAKHQVGPDMQVKCNLPACSPHGQGEQIGACELTLSQQTLTINQSHSKQADIALDVIACDGPVIQVSRVGRLFYHDVLM